MPSSRATNVKAPTELGAPIDRLIIASAELFRVNESPWGELGKLADDIGKNLRVWLYGEATYKHAEKEIFTAIALIGDFIDTLRDHYYAKEPVRTLTPPAKRLMAVGIALEEMAQVFDGATGHPFSDGEVLLRVARIYQELGSAGLFVYAQRNAVTGWQNQALIPVIQNIIYLAKSEEQTARRLLRPDKDIPPELRQG